MFKCICMCVYVSVYACVYMHVCVTCECVYENVCACLYVCACTCECMYVGGRWVHVWVVHGCVGIKCQPQV